MRPLRSVGEVTPQWCTSALSGRIGTAQVTTVSHEQIGTGQMADTYRLRLGYDRVTAGPGSCVVKVTAQASASRTAAKVMHAYEVEARFYQHLAPTLAVRRPWCYCACYDEDSGAFTLLLEDVRGGLVADQVEGCQPTDAERAVDELAALHGPRWGDPALASLPWLPRHDGPGAARMASFVRTVYPRFVRRFADRLDVDVRRLVETFVPRVEQYLGERPGPRTVVHGDFRADNLVLTPGRITVLDWQTAAHEPAVTDLSYFLGGSLNAVARRVVERSVVARYVEALRRFGVILTVEDCWRSYRRYALGGLLMSIVGSTLVPRTERGETMFAVMTNRHGRHALDLDALALLP